MQQVHQHERVSSIKLRSVQPKLMPKCCRPVTPACCLPQAGRLLGRRPPASQGSHRAAAGGSSWPAGVHVTAPISSVAPSRPRRPQCSCRPHRRRRLPHCWCIGARLPGRLQRSVGSLPGCCCPLPLLCPGSVLRRRQARGACRRRLCCRLTRGCCGRPRHRCSCRRLSSTQACHGRLGCCLRRCQLPHKWGRALGGCLCCLRGGGGLAPRRCAPLPLLKFPHDFLSRPPHFVQL